VLWFKSTEQAIALAPRADIGWCDLNDKAEMFKIISAATNLKWLNSIYAGVDGMPLDQLKSQGTVVTNGAGISAITIAEYVVMGMLTVAKGYREVVRAGDRREWFRSAWHAASCAVIAVAACWGQTIGVRRCQIWTG
jgi:phosphoglycerate dehydrogenase-like enzyme